MLNIFPISKKNGQNKFRVVWKFKKRERNFEYYKGFYFFSLFLSFVLLIFLLSWKDPFPFCLGVEFAFGITLHLCFRSQKFWDGHPENVDFKCSIFFLSCWFDISPLTIKKKKRKENQNIRFKKKLKKIENKK